MGSYVEFRVNRIMRLERQFGLRPEASDRRESVPTGPAVASEFPRNPDVSLTTPRIAGANVRPMTSTRPIVAGAAMSESPVAMHLRGPITQAAIARNFSRMKEMQPWPD